MVDMLQSLQFKLKLVKWYEKQKLDRVYIIEFEKGLSETNLNSCNNVTNPVFPIFFYSCLQTNRAQWHALKSII